MKIISQVVFFTFCSLPIFAQNNSLSQLFYPNVTLSSEFSPNVSYKALDGNHEFGFSRTSVLGFFPLRSEVNLNIGIGSKFDLKAKQTVLVTNFSQISPTVDFKEQPANGFKTAHVGVIQLQASFRDKFWVYGGGAGFTESNETFFSPQPFLWGGVGRLRIFGLNAQILYGTAVVYNQKFRIVPIFGFNKKLGKNWRVSGLLPFQANVARKVTDWMNVSGNMAYNGFSGGFQDIIGAEKIPRKENYQQVKFTLAANFHLLKVINLSLEGGISTFRNLSYVNAFGDNLASYSPSTAPYFGVSLRYIAGKSSLGSKLLGKVGAF